MSKRADQDAPPAIARAFGSDCVVVPIAAILPVKAIEKTAKSSHKYRQIAASMLASGERRGEFTRAIQGGEVDRNRLYGFGRVRRGVADSGHGQAA